MWRSKGQPQARATPIQEAGPFRGIECVSSSIQEISYHGTLIVTPLAAKEVQDVFLDRLWKEILSQKKNDDDDVSTGTSIRRQRFCLGINACTRVLEGEQERRSSIGLVVLATTDTVASHIPILCSDHHHHHHGEQKQIPILLLDPEKAIALGKLFGIRRVSCMAIFLTPASNNKKDLADTAATANDPVDSFLAFILSTMNAYR